jgi:hypothetical protein
MVNTEVANLNREQMSLNVDKQIQAKYHIHMKNASLFHPSW